jgi:hypothetical protein
MHAHIRFVAPTPDTPGFLRRALRAMELRNRISEGASAEFVKEVAQFLLDYVSEPADRDAAYEAILDASQQEFTDMLNVFTTSIGGGKSSVPLASRGSSNSGTSTDAVKSRSGFSSSMQPEATRSEHKRSKHR